MQETIFEIPEQTEEGSRLSWLFTDPTEDTLLDTQMEWIYATREPSLNVEEWPLH